MTVITIVDLSLFLEEGICIIFLIVSNILARQIKSSKGMNHDMLQKTVKSGLGIVSLFGNYVLKTFLALVQRHSLLNIYYALDKDLKNASTCSCVLFCFFFLMSHRRVFCLYSLLRKNFQFNCIL